MAAAERRAARSASQRASTLRRLALVWLVGLAGLSVVALQHRVPIEDLLLDPSVVGGGRWYGGLVTSIGVVVWTVASVAAFGAGYVSWLVGRVGACVTMVSSSAIIALLLFDDLFLLHTAVVPALTGLPKLGLVIFEAMAVVVWGATCRKEISRTRWELLVAAGFGFALSLVFDQTLPASVQALLLEDGAKLLGVLALAAWAVSTAADLTRSMVGSRR